MKVLCHHIYEYKKGLRHLVLHTLDSSFRYDAEWKLKQQGIEYVVREVSASKINLFFGNKECIDIIREIGDKKLNEFTPEEDFMLGTMLGYNPLQQCKRYLNKKEKERNFLFKYLTPNIA
ncbi:MAG: DUF2023 family protein [Candidatus Azobacteroides sp.]|nr:DUF2023 family protein [Candidatus Azobacteroides sp.]